MTNHGAIKCGCCSRYIPASEWKAAVPVAVHDDCAGRPASPKRIKGVIVDSCDCCGRPTDDYAHINHCRAGI